MGITDAIKSAGGKIKHEITEGSIGTRIQKAHYGAKNVYHEFDYERIPSHYKHFKTRAKKGIEPALKKAARSTYKTIKKRIKRKSYGERNRMLHTQEREARLSERQLRLEERRLRLQHRQRGLSAQQREHSSFPIISIGGKGRKGGRTLWD